MDKINKNVKLVRKLDRIFRHIELGHNPMHHHPKFSRNDYHYSTLAQDLNITYRQVALICSYATLADSKKDFILNACRVLRVNPKLVDSRW